MYNLISIGSISIDLYFKGNSLTFKDERFQLAIGGKYLADNFYVGIGGGGTNVAIAAGKNGLKTAVMGKIGNNVFKKIILDKLVENNISHTLCDFENSYYNVSLIILSPNGERSIIHYVTPHQHLFSDSNDLKDVTKTKMVYLGNLPDVSLTERSEVLHFFKKKGVKTVVNLGVKDCRKSLKELHHFLGGADILILNGHEFSELVKAPYKDIHFKEHVVKWYIPSLIEKLVVITEGEKGSYAYLGNNLYRQPAERITKIVDTTGAGDGYTGAFIAEYLKSGNVEKSMDKASVFASKILQRVGAN